VALSVDSAPNIAIFCDYENVALGVRDAKFESLDIQLVLERLLDKGKIVVKKAYSDWERYKSARRPLHEAGFELIEIPHVSYSGKNSADIRLVVDALDLCYIKGHVDMFAIVSGDSDFSPLVSKLRENNKQVIGLGVKNSSSDLLIENCDEFIFYDDLVRDKATQHKKPQRGGGRALRAKPKDKPRGSGENKPSKVHTEKSRGERLEESPEEAARTSEAMEIVLDTAESLFRDRGDNVWGSMIKQTLKRKRPSFSESYYGFRSFNELLEAAAARGLVELQKDEKSGGYIVLGFGPNA
jgi:uncharacterized protein (TIGR00288 family)